MRRICTALLLASLAAAGCGFETEPDDPVDLRPARTVVINELFTLPPDAPNSHSWIELLNPTGATADLRDWTLSFTTRRTRITQLLFKDTLDNNGVITVYYAFTAELFQTDPADSVHAVPFASRRTGRELRPNELMTLVSNLDRLEVYTTPPDGFGPDPVSTPAFETVPDTILVPVDTTYANLSVPDTIRYMVYLFQLKTTDQVVLRDAAGNVVDVVRYGNYVATGTDPFPSNRSAGPLPANESLARFAGGYYTGNTANDFYATRGRELPTTPQYFNQQVKLP